MDPWYKTVTPRKEVREGRSFNPEEFAIALEQVAAGTAPEDYRDPAKFFARTWFTRALCEHVGMVLRRLSGMTVNTPAVLTLITQFGGGKTHTLTSLYHLARNAPSAADYPGVRDLLKDAGLGVVPSAKVAVFVGNAWDPKEGAETPWIDVARQLAGQAGVDALGPTAKDTPPGTDAIGSVFAAADAPVLVLFDEVLNYVNRHRGMADSFYAFLDNLIRTMTGTTYGSAVISLPRSQVEMTDWDLQWQEKITKVVRRVARDLISNDEGEIAEVIRRRLFDDIGGERVRKNTAKAYADWCFDRRAQLPPEWTAVDTATTEAKAKELLRGRFEACYPFHPATLSVFQRKWQALSQYQQTRGTLAMLAQWVSRAALDGYRSARPEALITLGSAPLQAPEFKAVVLGQLGEPRLSTAIDIDIAGEVSHARALDADTKGLLKDIHRRVGSAILFESSGAQVDKTAHLPELRFALIEPGIETTSIDTAAMALEARGFYTRRVGTDGFKIGHQPTLRKVVNDRRASLDEAEVQEAMRALVQGEFERGHVVPLLPFPADSMAVPDAPRLTLVVMGPDAQWTGDGNVRQEIAAWTRQRGHASRSYPAALVWSLKRPGRDLRDKTELLLAWRRVAAEARGGTLGEIADHGDIAVRLKDAEGDAKDEVWGSYRFVVVADSRESDGIKIIDLGAGHASSSETLTGRIVSALKSSGLLSESVGAGYIDRNWPPALQASGAWPLQGLRQSFLNGTLTRLLDPDAVLKQKIVELVGQGEFGLASGAHSDGSYSRVWYNEPISPDEVAFDSDVYLLTKAAVEKLRLPPGPLPSPGPVSGETEGEGSGESGEPGAGGSGPSSPPGANTCTLRVSGNVPPEVWNRLGTRLIPKLRSGSGLTARVEFDVTVESSQASSLEVDLRQTLDDLGLSGEVSITTQLVTARQPSSS